MSLQILTEKNLFLQGTFRNILASLQVEQFYDRFAKFVFIFSRTQNKSLNFIEFSVYLTKYGILNFIFIDWTSDDDIKLMTVAFNSKRIEYFKTGDSIQQIFYDKLNNINGYELKIAQDVSPYQSMLRYNNENKSFQFLGIDGQLFNIIKKRMNATSKVLKTQNTKFEMLFKQNKIDLTMYRKHVKSSEVQYLNKYIEFCVIVPNNPFNSKDILLRNSLPLSIYCMTVAILTICNFFNLKIQKKFPRDIVCYAIYGGPFAGHRMRFLERYVILLVAIYFSFINNFYATNLTSMFTVSETRHEFKTINEFLETPNKYVQLFVPASILPYMMNNYPQYSSRYGVRKVPVSNFIDFLNDHVNRNNANLMACETSRFL